MYSVHRMSGFWAKMLLSISNVCMDLLPISPNSLMVTYWGGSVISNNMSDALRKHVFYFLSNWMGYGRGDSFLFDSQPNGIPSGSKSKGNPSSRSYPLKLKGNGMLVFSVRLKYLQRSGVQPSEVLKGNPWNPSKIPPLSHHQV